MDACFAILGQQRSGTTLIQKLLGTRPDAVLFEQEFWGANLFGSFLSKWINQSKGFEYSRDVLTGLLRSSATLQHKHSAGVLGLKANYNSFEDVVAIRDGIEQGFSWMNFIVIIRRDHVAKLGSHMRAGKANKWHSWDLVSSTLSESDLTFEIPETADVKRYLISSVLADRELIELVQSLPSALMLNYETDILPDPLIAMRKIEAFLGLSAHMYNVDEFAKVSPEPGKYIINYEKLSRLLQDYAMADTPFLEVTKAKLERRIRWASAFTRLWRVVLRR